MKSPLFILKLILIHFWSAIILLMCDFFLLDQLDLIQLHKSDKT